ncbi:MAG: lytic transglycosylase domain-containing protein [Deltaproteobacteria bacterium]|nr:MAG: lytic transglycosylase domain-containing protein [Deltaproteobacteria bacterium]
MNTLKTILSILFVLSILSLPEALSSQQSAALMLMDKSIPPAILPVPSQSAPPVSSHKNLSQFKNTLSVYLSTPHQPYSTIIKTAAARHKIDPALVKAVIMAESRYNHLAVSKKGAGGLMQLMPNTAKSLGVQDIFDPEDNITGGVRYLKKLLNRFDGDTKLALAAYNAGSRYVRHYGGIPPFRQTRTFIKNVLKYQQMYKTNALKGNEIV